MPLHLSRMRRWYRTVLCALLTVLLSGCSSIQTAAAESSGKLLYDDYIYYTISEKGEVTIKSARASVTEAVIPEKIDGYPVTEVESYAFRDCTKLKRLVLPENVRKIGDYAFLNCKNLEILYIPDTVEDIGWGVVTGTLWLSEQKDDFVVAGQGILLAYTGESECVEVPENIRVIGGYAFSGCETVKSVQLPASLTVIDAFAFDKCQNLRRVEIPDSVTTIGEYAFHWCTSLQEADMPDSVTTVEPHAFSYCKSLESIRLSNSLQQLSSAVFSNCICLKSITLPESIKLINNYAFQGCTALEVIELPASVTEIGIGVFDKCTGLLDLTIQNPACRIYDDASTLSSSGVIHGQISSTAFIYANKYGCSFSALNQLRGDYDSDGVISLMDAYNILMLSSRVYLGNAMELTDTQQYAADFDKNGRISIEDAYAVLILSSRIAIGDKTAYEEAV